MMLLDDADGDAIAGAYAILVQLILPSCHCWKKYALMQAAGV